MSLGGGGGDRLTGRSFGVAAGGVFAFLCIERHFHVFVILGGAPSLTGFGRVCGRMPVPLLRVRTFVPSVPSYVTSRAPVETFVFFSLFFAFFIFSVFLSGFDSILLPQTRG